jgi:hypothetical protein
MHLSKHLLHVAIFSAFLPLVASAGDTARWRIHAGIASDALGGTLLKTGNGLAKSVTYGDAFGRSDRQAVGIGFLITPDQELSLSLGLDRAGGNTIALGAVNGVRLAGTLSDFEARRVELGYRYSFANANESGFFLGAQIGRERHNTVSARLASGRSEVLFNRSSGYSYGISAGYQWAFNDALSLSVEVAPTRRPGFDVNSAGAAALGIQARKSSGALSVPVSLRFSYTF